MDRIGRLEIYRPPVENLIAAKLIRAEPKDISDIRFLVALHRPDALRNPRHCRHPSRSQP